MIKYCKPLLLQINFLSLGLINTLYSVVPFFILRHTLLRIIGIRIGKRTALHSKIRFFSFGKLTIGHNSTVNRGCYLDNRRGITIGNNVMIAHDSKIYTLGHDIQDPFFNTKGSPVTIKDYAVLFANVLVMPGVTIGEGAVALTGAVVTKDILPYKIVGGNPAKVIGERNHDLQYTIDYLFWQAL